MNVIFVLSMPRSGSSFLGQLLSADESTVVRLSPFFSYSLGECSRSIKSREDFNSWVFNLLHTNDEFVTQSESISKGIYPTEQEKTNVKTLVIKDTRNIFDYIELFLKYSEIKIIFLDRRLDEQLSSWITSPEFKGLPIDSPNLLLANERKALEHFPYTEYWGVQDILYFKTLSRDLSNKYPRRVLKITYDSLVQGKVSGISQIVPDLDLDLLIGRYNELTNKNNNTTSQDSDPYSVYRPRNYTPRRLKVEDLPDKFLHELLSL